MYLLPYLFMKLINWIFCCSLIFFFSQAYVFKVAPMLGLTRMIAVRILILIATLVALSMNKRLRMLAAPATSDSMSL